MYLRNMRNSQMFFFAIICSRDVVETQIKVRAAKLWKKCTEFDFLLDSSYSNAHDVKTGLEQYKKKKFWVMGKVFQHVNPISEKIAT